MQRGHVGIAPDAARAIGLCVEVVEARAEEGHLGAALPRPPRRVKADVVVWLLVELVRVRVMVTLILPLPLPLPQPLPLPLTLPLTLTLNPTLYCICAVASAIKSTPLSETEKETWLGLGLGLGLGPGLETEKGTVPGEPARKEGHTSTSSLSTLG